MLIAKQKRQENIAEYLIYMWQIEDQIRALNFDINNIKTYIIQKYDQPDEIKKEIEEWYENLIMLMKNEGIEKSGHLQVTKNILSDLYNTHLYLLKSPKEVKYQTLYFSIKPEIEQLKQKTGDSNDINACFSFLYGTLILRLKKKKLLKETEDSLKKISGLISTLAKKHMFLENGKDEFIL